MDPWAHEKKAHVGTGASRVKVKGMMVPGQGSDGLDPAAVSGSQGMESMFKRKGVREASKVGEGGISLTTGDFRNPEELFGGPRSLNRRPSTYVSGRSKLTNYGLNEVGGSQVSFDQVGHHDYDGDESTEYRYTNKHKRGACLIHPTSKAMVFWEVFLILLLLYTATWTPYEVAFLDHAGDLDIVVDPLFIINRVVDVAFVLDIFLTFLTPYREGDRIVDDNLSIIARYLRGWFIVDLVSVVPYDLLAVLIKSNGVEHLKSSRVLRLLRLARVLRIFRARRVFQKFEATQEIKYSLISLGMFSVGVLALAHWMACLFYLVSVAEDKDESWVTSYFDVFAESNLKADGTPGEVDNLSLYVASLYWSVATLSTLGYGDIVPRTNPERMYSVLCTFIGGGVYAYLLGSVCSIITSMDEGSSVFYRQMEDLNKFMKEKKLPPGLRVKLRDFFRFRRNYRAAIEWSNVMHLMSDSLRLEVADRVFGKWIRAMPIFKECPRRLPGLLAAHLTSQVLGPHEDLMANPTKRDCLFVIEKGLIAHRGYIQEPGTLLGVERIYATASQLSGPQIPAITLCHSIALCLERDAVLHVVGMFPKVKRTMRNVVVRILLRRSVVSYTRAVVRSTDKRGFATLMRMVGQNDGLARLAAQHRLALMRRFAPEEFATVMTATEIIQRCYKRFRMRKMVSLIRIAGRASCPHARSLYELLDEVRLERYFPRLMKLKVTPRHLHVVSVSDLSKAAGMSFHEAANLLLAVQKSNTRGDRGNCGIEEGDSFGVSDGSSAAAATVSRVEDATGRLLRAAAEAEERLRWKSSSAVAGVPASPAFEGLDGRIATLEDKLDATLASVSTLVALQHEHQKQLQRQDTRQPSARELRHEGGEGFPGHPNPLFSPRVTGWNNGGGRFAVDSPGSLQHQPWESSVPPTPTTAARGLFRDEGVSGSGRGVETEDVELVPMSAAALAAGAFVRASEDGGAGMDGTETRSVGGRVDVASTVLAAASKFREAANRARGVGTPK